jgi:hypothetical protein
MRDREFWQKTLLGTENAVLRTLTKSEETPRLGGACLPYWMLENSQIFIIYP